MTAPFRFRPGGDVATPGSSPPRAPLGQLLEERLEQQALVDRRHLGGGGAGESPLALPADASAPPPVVELLRLARWGGDRNSSRKAADVLERVGRQLLLGGQLARV